MGKPQDSSDEERGGRGGGHLDLELPALAQPAAAAAAGKKMKEGKAWGGEGDGPDEKGPKRQSQALLPFRSARREFVLR